VIGVAEIGAVASYEHAYALVRAHGEAMATPPDSTKTSLRQQLAERARERWHQLVGVTVRWHGQFATS
jgi:hypothetical protein